MSAILARPGTDSEADRLVKTLLRHVQHATKPIPFHGYYFHIVPNPGGFAAIAYRSGCTGRAGVMPPA
jgi:hypothetical protein